MSCSLLFSNSIVRSIGDNGIMLVLSLCTPYIPFLAYLCLLSVRIFKMLQESVCVVCVQSEPRAGEKLIRLPSILILLSDGYSLHVWLLNYILNNVLVLGHLLYPFTLSLNIVSRCTPGILAPLTASLWRLDFPQPELGYNTSFNSGSQDLFSPLHCFPMWATFQDMMKSNQFYI